MKNPWDVVSGFKHDSRLKCHRGIVSQWTFQVGLNVTVDETWVDVTSRHRDRLGEDIRCLQVSRSVTTSILTEEKPLPSATDGNGLRLQT